MWSARSKAAEPRQYAIDDKPKLLWSDYAPKAVPRTECSINVKIAWEKNANERQKKNLDCLYEDFAPDETDWKTRSTTLVIKELCKNEVRVHISDKPKSGSREEKNTDIEEFILGKPAKLLQKGSNSK